MSKRSIVDQLRAHGVVAAHQENNYVEIVRGKPKKVTWSLPLFEDSKKLGKNDIIAIVNVHDGVAYICKITRVETVGLFKRSG